MKDDNWKLSLTEVKLPLGTRRVEFRFNSGECNYAGYRRSA
jgi:hypothetical protein